MSGFISKDKLSGILGKEKMEMLGDAAIDKGAAFLGGQITSSFNKVMMNSAVVQTINTASLGAGLYSTGKALVGDNAAMLQQLATDIIAGSVDVAAGEMSKIAGKIAGKAAQIPLSIPSRIQSYTMSAFNEYKKSLGDIIKEVMTDQDDLNEQSHEEQNTKAQNKTLEAVKKGLAQAQEFIDKNMGTLNAYLGKIADYIEEGPDMIAKEVDYRVSECISAANKQVDQKIQDVEDYVNRECKQQGEKIGKKMADKYNEELTKQAKKMLASQKTAISKAMTLVFKAKQMAALQVMALTGINIPV